jgi:hypothetical protein
MFNKTIEDLASKFCNNLCDSCKANGKCRNNTNYAPTQELQSNKISPQQKAKAMFDFYDKILKIQFNESSNLLAVTFALQEVDAVLNVIYDNWYDSQNGVYEYYLAVKEEIFKIK